jgi:type VII secretion EssC-like protein
LYKPQLPGSQFANTPTEVFNRPPRIMTPVPQGKVEIPELPKRDLPPQKPGVMTLLMPVIMIVVLLGVYIGISHVSMQQITFLLPICIFTLMYPLTNWLTIYQQTKAINSRNKENDKKYRKALGKIRRQLRNLVEEQRQVALLSNPPSTDLEAQISERIYLWERRPEDEDFLAVRVGTGTRAFSIEITTPQLDTTDPLTPDVQRIAEEFRMAPDIPCTISLMESKSLGFTGERRHVAAFSRAVICQLATQHSPEEVRILGIYPASQRQDWEWLRELPHTMPMRGCKSDRLTATGEDEANELLHFLLEELSQRASKISETPSAGNAVDRTITLPHIVVIVHDYVEVRKHPALTHAFKLGEQLGVSVIYLVAQHQAIPGDCRGVVQLEDDGQLTYAATGSDAEKLENITADALDLEQAMRIARSLGRIQIIHDDDDTSAMPTDVRFLDLIDLAYADQFEPENWWTQPRFGMLRVPIGIGQNGIVWIDLNEHMHGPHGIIAGTTGSGKSELLQSLIVGLTMTHHPHLVNFVLVDFKGGAAFKAFEKIPHTVGFVTDLSGKLTERALVALKSELKRREHILSKANANKIAEYIALRSQNTDTYEPMPHLFIIIDEFAELAKEHPTFMDGLVSVVQKGRSLGVHLILATQKPAGSVSANIWSNLKFRICLRVASLQDSRDMLGRSEAALLPSTIPGRGYFQIGSETFELFQGARTSQEARVANAASIAIRQAKIGAGEASDQAILMDIIEPYTETIGATLFKPWPAPLPGRISLPEVYKRALATIPARELQSAIPPFGWLACPVGMIDQPTEQRQVPWILDMLRMGGHILISGASGSGKSIFLRTLITSLAQTHSPAQLHFYIIDFGGQALRVLDKLPHVGGFFNESDDEYIRRLLHKLNVIIDERKQLFAGKQIDDFPTYQRRHLERPDMAEMPAIMLVIDKFIEFKQAYDRDMDQLLSIARGGRTYGVYLVFSADRPASLPVQVISQLEIRIGLRLVEVTDSLLLLGKNDAAYVDPGLPGRGYLRGKTLDEVHIALPVACEDDDEMVNKLDELARMFARLTKLPTASRPQPIQLLPEEVSAHDLLLEAFTSATTQNGNHGVVNPPQALKLHLGIEDFSLRSVALELNADTPHALIAGGPGSGRTNTLRILLLMLATPQNRHARVVLVDFRRTSRRLRRLPGVWLYADTEEHLAAAVDALKAELRQRLTRFREELEQLPEDSDQTPGAYLAPIILMIDDYEQINALMRNPLNDLKEFLLQSRDLRLHLIVAGTPSDLNRSDPITQQCRMFRTGIILGSDATDPQLLGVRMGDHPPGRGHLVRRNQRSVVQIAYLALDMLPHWIHRLAQPSMPSETRSKTATHAASIDVTSLV